MRLTLLGGASALIGLALATGAQAQTAGDINRLNAAMQICNSPAGATMAECAQLRAKMGMSAGPSISLPGGGLGGLAGGNKAAAAAGLLGVLTQSRPQAVTVAPASPAVNAAAVQEAIKTCVQNAGGNATAIQACLQIATGARPAAAPASRPSLGIGAYQAQSQAAALPPGTLPTVANSHAAAMATYQAGQSYQACAAANPTNWQSCLPLLNGGQPR
jgi:hypothetical protein